MVVAPLLYAQQAPHPAPQARPASPPVIAAHILARLPHDRKAFTEGLFYRDGHLFESTGEVGVSDIRKVDPATGKVIRRVAIDPSLFGEGIAPWGDQIVSVTWKSGKGFRWNRASLRQVGAFNYPGEGWGMTSTATDLILSDGTAQLRFLDPKSFAERRRVTVTFAGRPLANLNELEWVDGTILANVWRQNAIVQIDPETGAVTKVIDLTTLAKEIDAHDVDSVLNGIAWDAKGRRLFVTGKNWPTLFQIAWP
ncbi:glutaminyl-peptide cyclotransferase [Stakelama sp. CBK3Z-3]|uniref:Glutaminyl-peptide cyclotransferase n=1 Tax=Stakelama flava TaxID=2860338 RepID=A0ABS6XK75_9SPHN|nr:glutaminyl-peptide cyclotransferase [Stakelama flava]